MTALNELRRHMNLDWKKMGREKMREHLEQSLLRIDEEQEKVIKKLGASSSTEMDRMIMTGQIKGKEAASLMHQYTRMCSLARLAKDALEELKQPDPDAIEDEFEGTRRY